MVYAPNDPSTLIAGLNGDSAAFTALLANCDDAYANHSPTLVCCSVSFEVSAMSATPVGEFAIPANDATAACASGPTGAEPPGTQRR